MNFYRVKFCFEFQEGLNSFGWIYPEQISFQDWSNRTGESFVLSWLTWPRLCRVKVVKGRLMES